MRARLLFSVAFTLAAFACTSAPEEEPVSEQDVVSGLRAEDSDPCTATLVFLQKDAYKPTGRSNELWPPHTTTVLEVSCQTANGEQRIAPYKENYGTLPGAKDEQGNDMLTKVEMDPSVVTTNAPWGEMKKLVASYEDCGCDPDEFLGLDTIDAKGKVILEQMMAILDCPDGSRESLPLALKEKRFSDAKGIVGKCRIRQGTTPGEIVEAAARVEREVRATFENHHVCNNNALLQADLFGRFRDNGDAKKCDSHNRSLCYGPKLFFNPKKEVH